MKEQHVPFGPIAREHMAMQCQYAVRYLLQTDGYAWLGDGLRTTGDLADYHAVTIHQDDVAPFLERWRARRPKTDA